MKDVAKTVHVGGEQRHKEHRVRTSPPRLSSGYNPSPSPSCVALPNLFAAFTLYLFFYPLKFDRSFDLRLILAFSPTRRKLRQDHLGRRSNIHHERARQVHIFLSYSSHLQVHRYS